MTSSDAQTIFPTAVASILDADDRQFKSFISETSLRAKSASRTTCCAADHEFCKDERDLDAFARLVADRRAERMTNEAGLTQEETHGLASILAKVATGVDTSAEDEGGLPPWCDVSALRSWTISATSAEMTTDELERLLAEEVAREDEMLEALEKERETRAIWETGRVKEEIRQATIEEEAELGRRERCVIDQVRDGNGSECSPGAEFKMSFDIAQRRSPTQSGGLGYGTSLPCAPPPKRYPSTSESCGTIRLQRRVRAGDSVFSRS